MCVIDLTHVITPDMPACPETEPPRLETVSTYARDGFREPRRFFSAHMDPPTCSQQDAPWTVFRRTASWAPPRWRTVRT